MYRRADVVSLPAHERDDAAGGEIAMTGSAALAGRRTPSSRSGGVRFGRVAGAGVTGLALLAAGLVAAAPPAGAVTANPAPSAGARRSATRLPFTISGSAGLSVDVATGNTLFVDRLLTLPGATGDVPVTVAFNQDLLFSSVPSAMTGTTGSGWSISGFDQRLVANSDGSVTYYGPADLTGVFTKTSTGPT